MKVCRYCRIKIQALFVFLVMLLPYVHVYVGLCFHCGNNCVLKETKVRETDRTVPDDSIINVADNDSFKIFDDENKQVAKLDRLEQRKKEMLIKMRLQKAKLFHQDTELYYMYDDENARGKPDKSLLNSYYNQTKSGKVLNPLNRNIVLANGNMCNETPVMFVLVPSIPQNREIRDAIRQTYGKFSRRSDTHAPKIKMSFFLGKSENLSTDVAVQKEYSEYKDLVVIDFIDSYFNLTLKILHGLEWLNKYCKGIKYVLKADEDVFVNIELLLAELSTYPTYKQGSVYGTILLGSNLHVLKHGKWGVTVEEYPFLRYPPYAQGTSYTLTANLIPKILKTAKQLPYLHIEDAFITGIIAGQIHGAKLERLLGNSNWGDMTPEPCRFVKSERLAQTKMTAQLMYKIWKTFNSPDTECKDRNYTILHHRSNYHLKT